MKKLYIPGMIIVGFLLVVSTTYAAVKIINNSNQGLRVNWKFDENTGTAGLLDSSGNGNSIALYGDSAPTWTQGRWGSAVSYDGDSQYSLTDNPVSGSLGVIDQPYTISTWVKIAPGETNGNIIHVSSQSNGHGWCTPLLVLDDGKFSAVSYNSGRESLTQDDTPTIDTWHHVVTTWSSTNGLRLYVDGELKASSPQSNFTAADMPVYIQPARGGSGCISDKGFFEGSIDDIKIYTKELSQNKISALYSNNTNSLATISRSSSGLKGEFYSGVDFDVYVSSAIDQTINFDPADDTIGTTRVGRTTNYSARWTGYVTPEYSETYTFYTTSDDGVRLYVDNQLIIDNWTLHSETENTGSINLIAGHRYPIKLEFKNVIGGSVIKLEWSSNSQPQQIVPSSALSYFSGIAKLNDSRNSKITDGLVGIWSFDGPDVRWYDSTSVEAKDRSGHNNNGLSESMSRSFSPMKGAIGQGLYFDGENDYIPIPNTLNDLLNNSNEITVSAWLKPDGTIFYQDSAAVVTEAFEGDGSVKFALMTNFDDNKKVSAGFYDGNWRYVNDSDDFPFGKGWVHLAATYNGSTLKLYVNGVLKSQQTYNLPLPGGTERWLIGRRWDNPNFIQGGIDDVRVYNRALSESEIRTLHLMGK